MRYSITKTKFVNAFFTLYVSFQSYASSVVSSVNCRRLLNANLTISRITGHAGTAEIVMSSIPATAFLYAIVMNKYTPVTGQMNMNAKQTHNRYEMRRALAIDLTNRIPTPNSIMIIIVYRTGELTSSKHFLVLTGTVLTLILESICLTTWS